jgi:4-alpha-glucanotransferase
MYLDVPLGVHPEGYDGWRERSSFLEGVSAGAPPDELFTGGQEWGFRPLSPEGLCESRYQYFISSLRHQLGAAGVLRIDHVMGLHRIYCIPTGMNATEGLYVHFPHEELYAILTLESSRHRAMLVGEDLGTVPDAVREAMDAHALHRMYVLPFELRPDQAMIMGDIGSQTVASANTHDLPTFRGWWDASDVEIRCEMGLLDEGAAAAARHERERLTRTLAERLGQPHEPLAVLRAALEAIAASDARLVLVSLEDLWLEPDPQNVPGTHRERPNWRRKARLSLDEMRVDARVLDTLRAIAAKRGQPPPTRRA